MFHVERRGDVQLECWARLARSSACSVPRGTCGRDGRARVRCFEAFHVERGWPQRHANTAVERASVLGSASSRVPRGTWTRLIEADEATWSATSWAPSSWMRWPSRMREMHAACSTWNANAWRAPVRVRGASPVPRGTWAGLGRELVGHGGAWSCGGFGGVRSTWNAATRHPWCWPAPMSSGLRLAPSSRWLGLRPLHQSPRGGVPASSRTRVPRGTKKRRMRCCFAVVGGRRSACALRGDGDGGGAPAHRIDSRMRSAWREFLTLGGKDARADACTSVKWMARLLMRGLLSACSTWNAGWIDGGHARSAGEFADGSAFRLVMRSWFMEW
ncbi:hypothetical protein MXAN_7483 [Myxococcus xanthus DK 1622]|uniref:Uncharacterized protein n=1 Tax=Myxococcus xanthus (strain DK1622) TaxID=246197 RepID=Q1CVI9_MYXXD|nr:hypothetical protein MXAN_7483 [Myxococcus xanthus DK 1622]